ncbi:hypothetical protein [Nocardia sp. CA-120079]|uniref:hypothetical protein n=1 Tax=Nocardia sp. CA-120079 TaxID=3239974 RepID=UPI003D98B64A
MVTHRSRPIVTIVAVAALIAACTSDRSTTSGGSTAGPDAAPVAYREPVKLTSKDGVLEVRLSAHQGTVALVTFPHRLRLHR